MWASTQQDVQSLFSSGPSKQITPSTGVVAEFMLENVILIGIKTRFTSEAFLRPKIYKNLS